MHLNNLINHLQSLQKDYGDLDVLLLDTGRMIDFKDVDNKNLIDFYFPFKEDIKVINTGAFNNRKVVVFIDKKTLRLSKNYSKKEYKELITQMV